MPALDREYVRRLEDFTKALEGIVELLKEDTKKDNVDNVTRMLSNMDNNIGEIVKNIEIVKESVSKIEDQNDKIIREISELKKQKEGGGLGIISEVDNKKKIIDAVQMIVLIAGGILAIGLAFKIIAPVDFLSVLAIGLALVFISGAFVAVSTVMKEIEPKNAAKTMGLMILMSGAIAASSWLLAMASTLSFAKSLSIVFTTAALGISLYLMSKAVTDSKLTPADYPKMLLLPLVLPLIAAGIAFSSHFLGMIQPMSLGQMITTVFVAGALGASLFLISMALEKSKFTAGQVGKFLLLPILLPVIAASIVLSSLVLQNVQTLSFGQMVSSIFVAVTIGVLVYLMKPLIEKMEDLTFKSVVSAGLLVVALSAGLVAASWVLSKMTFFTLKEAFGMVITSIAIGLSILVLTPAIKMLKSIETKEMWQATKNVVIASGAIAVSSILLSLGMYNNYPDWRWAIGAGLSIIGFSGAIWVLNKMNIDNKKMLSLAVTTVGIATAIMLTSLILSLGNYDEYPPIGWAFGVGLSMMAFGGAIYLLGQKADVKSFIKGGLIALGVATALVLVSHILAAGNYKQYPTVEWGIGAGLSLVAFGAGIYLLGTFAKDPTALLVGALAALLVAGTIAVSSHILAMGAYDNYPTLEWSKGVGLSMVVFGGSMLLLGAAVIGTAGIGALAIIAGAFAMLYVAKTIVNVAEILSGGDYTGGPTSQWALGTGTLLFAVGATSVAFALLYPFIWLGRKSMILTAETIAEVSHILQKGDYKGGPTLEWAKGVSMSIKAFAEGSAALSGGLMGGLINKIFGIDQTGVITKIALSMVDASHILQKGDWSAYPSEEWSKGVGNSVMAFAKAIEAMEKGGVKGGFAILMTIRAVALGLIVAAETLNEFDWKNIKNYPSEAWSTAVGKAINAFAEPLSKLAENKITGREVKTGIKRIAQGMVAAAETLAEINWLEYNDIYPHKDWVNGVGNALEVFVKYLSEIEKNDIGSGELKVLKRTINAMIYSARSFKIAEMIFSGLWDAGPRNDWSSRVGNSIGVFVKYLTEIEKNDIGTGDVKVLYKTIDSMIDTARRFKIAELIFKDIWQAGPKLDWSKSTGEAIGTFVDFLERIEKSNIGKGDLKVLNSTIDSMIGTAYRFMMAENISKSIWQSGPDNAWVERTGKAISLFVNYLTQIEESGAGKGDLKLLDGTISTMISTAYSFRNAQFLYKDLWKGYPSLEWVMATGLAISTFVNYLIEIEESGAGITDLNVLRSIIGSIIRTATGFQMAQKQYPGLWNAGPSKEWALNIGNIITAFVDNLIAIDNAGISGKNLRIFQGVVEGIINTSNAFSKGTWSTPPSNWITDMSKAVGEFVKQLIIIDRIEIGKDDLKKFNKILSSIINTAKDLQDIKPIGLTKEWSENTGKAIGEFVKHIAYIESNDIGVGDTVVFNKTVDSIIRTALRFSLAEKLSPNMWASGPSKQWASGIGEALTVFVKHLAMIEEYGKGEFNVNKLNSTIDSIIGTALHFYLAENNIGKQLWSTGPSSEWTTSVGKSISNFAQQVDLIGKSNIKVWDLWKIGRIVGAIVETAERYHEIETSKPGVWKAGPSLEWATSVSKIVLTFAQASLIASGANNLAGIDGLGDKMISFTTKLDKAFTGKKFFGKGGLFEAFAHSIKNLSSSFTTNDKLSGGLNQFASAMIKISSMGTSTTDSIKMMTKSIELLSAALEDVDMESIDKLAKFSNGLLVLSLIDEDKFEKAFDVLQQKKNDIISILSDNNAVKSSKYDYGSTRVEQPKTETKEAKDFYQKAIKHLGGLDSNVGKMLQKLNETPQQQPTSNEPNEVAPTPAKVTKK